MDCLVVSAKCWCLCSRLSGLVRNLNWIASEPAPALLDPSVTQCSSSKWHRTTPARQVRGLRSVFINCCVIQHYCLHAGIHLSPTASPRCTHTVAAADPPGPLQNRLRPISIHRLPRAAHYQHTKSAGSRSSFCVLNTTVVANASAPRCTHTVAAADPPHIDRQRCCRT